MVGANTSAPEATRSLAGASRIPMGGDSSPPPMCGHWGIAPVQSMKPVWLTSKKRSSGLGAAPKLHKPVILRNSQSQSESREAREV